MGEIRGLYLAALKHVKEDWKRLFGWFGIYLVIVLIISYSVGGFSTWLGSASPEAQPRLGVFIFWILSIGFPLSLSHLMLTLSRGEYEGFGDQGTYGYRHTWTSIKFGFFWGLILIIIGLILYFSVNLISGGKITHLSIFRFSLTDNRSSDPNPPIVSLITGIVMFCYSWYYLHSAFSLGDDFESGVLASFKKAWKSLTKAMLGKIILIYLPLALLTGLIGGACRAVVSPINEYINFEWAAVREAVKVNPEEVITITFKDGKKISLPPFTTPLPDCEDDLDDSECRRKVAQYMVSYWEYISEQTGLPLSESVVKYKNSPEPSYTLGKIVLIVTILLLFILMVYEMMLAALLYRRSIDERIDELIGISDGDDSAAPAGTNT